MRTGVLIAGCGLLLAGCYQGKDAPLDDGVGDGTGISAGDAGDGGSGSDGGEDGGDDGGPGVDCESGELAIGTTPLQRLSKGQYNATVRDLLNDATSPADDFVDDERRRGFDSNVSAVGELHVDQYRQAAKTLASTAALEQFDTWMPCDRGDTTCVGPFIDDMGLKAYRRPLTSEERQSYIDMYEQGRDQWGADTSIELVLQTMLMSPHFLYHVEIGEPGGDVDAVPLTGFEVASRLSYFLWGTMPDDDLFDAAAAGALSSREGVEQEARRMLAHEKAAEMVVSFGEQWLDLRGLDEVQRDPTAFPDWDPALLEAMRLETETFLEEIVLHGDGSLQTLLTAPHSYLDADLAAHYGVTLGGGDLGRTDLPAEERAGLLTHGSILVSHAYPSENSWVHRGKLVRERFLCGEMPPPPPEVDFENTNDLGRLDNPECQGCHMLMDPIGWGFDDYDATGRFVGLGQTGEVVGSEIGEFDSIPALAAGLAQDDMVRECFTENLGRFALGRDLAEGDECSHDAIYAAFEESGYDVRELMVAIATSDAFLYLSKETTP